MSHHLVLFIFGAMSTTLTTCEADSVRLRHLQTGQIAQCGPYGQLSSQTAAVTREQCISDYQRQGYERLK